MLISNGLFTETISELNVGMAVPDILGAISIEKLVEKDKAAEPAATIDDTGDLAAEKLL